MEELLNTERGILYISERLKDSQEARKKGYMYAFTCKYGDIFSISESETKHQFALVERGANESA